MGNDSAMQFQSSNQSGIIALLLFHSGFIGFDDLRVSVYAGTSSAGRACGWHDAGDATRRVDARYGDRADSTEPEKTDAGFFHRRIGPESAGSAAGLYEHLDGNNPHELLADRPGHHDGACRRSFAFDFDAVMKHRKRRLQNVADPQGRLDVLLYQLAVRTAERLEREQGIVGLQEHVLPLIEDAILAHVPQQSLIPREIAAMLRVCEMNKAKGYAQ